jgi:2'-5' RNA ligase
VRLFTAVEVSRETRAALAAEQRRMAASLGGAGTSLKWALPDRAHLTLVFIGPVDPTRAPVLIESLSRDVAAAPFDISFAGAGVFPPRGAPRVIWVGIGSGADALRELRGEMAARIAAQGIELERRDFHPHLTLGRWSASKPSDRSRALAAAHAGSLARDRVSRVTLFESRLSSSGASYIALAHANLTGT